MRRNEESTRKQILDAALRQFAAKGYSGTSVQDVISRTAFTKPTLYYHFGSKTGLFKALIEQASDECYEIIQSAGRTSECLEQQLVEIIAAMFQFFRDRKDLTRLAFAAAFAAPKELPGGVNAGARRLRTFRFLHALIVHGQAQGALARSLNSRTLTCGIYGALSFYLMANVLLPGTRLDRQTAQDVVSLFLNGARPDSQKRGRPGSESQPASRATKPRGAPLVERLSA